MVDEKIKKELMKLGVEYHKGKKGVLPARSYALKKGSKELRSLLFKVRYSDVSEKTGISLMGRGQQLNAEEIEEIEKCLNEYLKKTRKRTIPSNQETLREIHEKMPYLYVHKKEFLRKKGYKFKFDYLKNEEMPKIRNEYNEKGRKIGEVEEMKCDFECFKCDKNERGFCKKRNKWCYLLKYYRGVLNYI